MILQVDAGEGNFSYFLHDSIIPFGCWPSVEPKVLSVHMILWQTPQIASMHQHIVGQLQKHLQPIEHEQYEISAFWRAQEEP